MSKSKNDIAWQKLFDKHNISDKVKLEGSFEIQSAEINKFRESRLMTKFDHKSQLPKLFSENKLSILPISRGSYVISDIETFGEFKTTNTIEVERFNFPSHLESIDIDNISSESTALNCAFASGIINDFVEEEDILIPTVNGRMSSQTFDFNIKRNNSKNTLPINVMNSQIEIDGGYEGLNTLSLIEAKNNISSDFLIRQLFYPYKLWKNRVNKIVKSVYLEYSNGIFHFREFIFTDPNLYNSIYLVKEKKYSIIDKVINSEILRNIQQTSIICIEPNTPSFPQADSFERVINICELIKEKEYLTRDFITNNYDFDKRQTNYYTDAARYLGLIEKNVDNKDIKYSLTKKAEDIFNSNIADRHLKFIKVILSYRVFNKTLEKYFADCKPPSKGEVISIMKESKLREIEAEHTFSRRASTVISWVNWILDQIEE